MKARQRRPRAPKQETLSMDWFTETLEDLLDKSLQEDPRGCHSNVQEHQEAAENCVENLRLFHITNPYQFLNRWSTSEILGGLDAMVGQELQGNAILRPAGWLWSCLGDEAGGLEPAGYPGRSSEVVNSIARQLQLRGLSHPGYLVTTYPLGNILETINAVDQMIAKGIEVEDVPGLVTLLVEEGKSAKTEATMRKGEILTPAEMDMLRLIARGRSNEELCEELLISDHTRSSHLTSILSKLGARNRAHAVALALRRGILSEEDVNGPGES